MNISTYEYMINKMFEGIERGAQKKNLDSPLNEDEQLLIDRIFKTLDTFGFSPKYDKKQ